MATKSRLGKGLGALFPSLPGEPQHQEHAAPAAAAKEVKASKTDGHVESKSASATAQASVNAVQGMKHAVSRETTKKNQHRRASMAVDFVERKRASRGHVLRLHRSASFRTGQSSRGVFHVKPRRPNIRRTNQGTASRAGWISG